MLVIKTVRATKDFAQRYGGVAGWPEAPNAKKMVFPILYVIGSISFTPENKLLGNYRVRIPVCILEKLPHALNDSPSTKPLTNPHIIRGISVCLVSIFARKWREIVEPTVLSSGVCLPEIDAAILHLEDQMPGVYLNSSLGCSNREFAVVKSVWLMERASGARRAVVVSGSINPDGEEG